MTTPVKKLQGTILKKTGRSLAVTVTGSLIERLSPREP